ncbi:uncharacterized protein TNCT_306681 [Trichonephila clavata]|uniref:Uncharacterized protein n=1 Tax=Trichonephila clavata TaxID=2740835 RepID=A0A8X6LS48_TRICU|nr:uncharacterized protein TNCT_306681 [Trichonephila clavata]
MSTLTNSSSEDLSSVDKNPFRGRFARAFFSSCMGLPRNNAAYAANSDFEWDSVSEWRNKDMLIWTCDGYGNQVLATAISLADIHPKSKAVQLFVFASRVGFG